MIDWLLSPFPGTNLHVLAIIVAAAISWIATLWHLSRIRRLEEDAEIAGMTISLDQDELRCMRKRLRRCDPP